MHTERATDFTRSSSPCLGRDSQRWFVLRRDELRAQGEPDAVRLLEKSQFSDDEREQLLSQIDFSRVSEETIMACKNNKFMPQQLITDTALALCVKLRNELDETRNRLRVAESELNRARPGLASTTGKMIRSLSISLSRE